MHVCIYICMYVYVCMYECMYVCMYVCIFAPVDSFSRYLFFDVSDFLHVARNLYS